MINLHKICTSCS